MLHIKVPGKLMLAGEWGVLEEGNSCIVMAVNKYVTTSIKKNVKIVITSHELSPEKIEVVWQKKQLKVVTPLTEQQNKKFLFVQYALEMTLSYLEEHAITIKFFSLSLHSEHAMIKLHDGSVAKVGFGSSAAVVVGVTKALLAFHDYPTTTDVAKEIIFKLATIAHVKAQNNVGSGFDIAASAYGTTVYYKRFDAKWLTNKLAKQMQISSLVNQKWPSLQIVPIALPPSLSLCVGYVGLSASTPQLIENMQAFKESYPIRYKYLCASINTTVHALVKALQENNKEEILKLIRQNKQTLKHLSQESGVQIETKELQGLIEDAEKCGAASKFSGAGGGDCGIAICFDKHMAHKVTKRWEKNGFYPIETECLY